MRSYSRAGNNHLCERHGSPDRKAGEVHNVIVGTKYGTYTPTVPDPIILDSWMEAGAT